MCRYRRDSGGRPIELDEHWLNRLAEILSEDDQYPLDNTLLYARLERNCVAPSIFKDLGNRIIFRDYDLRVVSDSLLALWNAQATEPRWAEIEYIIRDGRFDASFTYPDQIDPEDDEFVRRDRVVARYFGEKPIHYPPPPDDEDEVFKL